MSRLLFFILFFVFLNSCDFLTGGQDGSAKESRPDPEEGKAPIKGKSCPTEIKSLRGTDCFFVLPHLKSGETFTGYYKDTPPKAITLGKGKWICKKGFWKTVLSPTCLTCRPGTNLNSCKTKLENSIKGQY